VVLAACASIVLAALLLEPSGEFVKAGPWTLPSVCTFRQITGIPCPGCGLTRSIVAAIHGDWSASYTYHRLGLVVVLYLAAQMAYRLTWLTVEPFRATIDRLGRIIDWALIPLMTLLFINWIPTLVDIFRTTG
jgi:hypothetical protein